MSDQKVTSSVGRNKLPTHVVGKLCSQWQKEHLSTAVILQNKHFFDSQFPQIYNRYRYIIGCKLRLRDHLPSKRGGLAMDREHKETEVCL